MTTRMVSGNPYGQITEREVETRGPERAAQLADSAALKLVVQDAARAESWLDQKQWSLSWRETDVLYQSPRLLQTWENSSTTRANVARFTVAKHVNALVPTVMSGIFYDNPPFVLRPRPSTTQATMRAKTALLAALLEDMEFKRECEGGIESQVAKGTGIWKWGCYTENKIEKRYIRKKSPARIAMPMGGDQTVNTAESDEFDVKEVEVSRWRPFFEFCPLGTVLPAPGWRHPNQIHRAKFVVHRQYLTFTDLNELRGRDGYDIPSEEQLKALFFPTPPVAEAPGAVEQQQASNGVVHHAQGRNEQETEDPLEQPMKVDERWDADRVMTVLYAPGGRIGAGQHILIRNEEHGLGCIPFLSANWWNIENAGFGLGVGRLTGADQRVEQGSINSAIDILSMAVNRSFLRARSANASTQQIRSRLGGIIDVDLGPGQKSVRDAFAVMETPNVPGEIWEVIRESREASESASGADEAMVQGRLPGRGGSSLGRTATGAGNMAAASAARIQGPVGRFVDNVFIPLLRHLDEMVNERMPLSEIRDILAEQTGDEEVDLDNFLNAKLRYEVLAGAHLAAKKAMAQSLPWMIQILENPHMVQSLNQTGWTVDLPELFGMVMEVSEWKNNRTLIRRMTDQEQQMFQQATSPQQQKVQGDLAKIQAKGQVDSQLTDQKAEARLASKLTEDAMARGAAYVERVAMERQMEPFVLGEGHGGEQGQYDTTA